MKSRPIIFSAPMVRAILRGVKTQTRRIAWEFDMHRQIRKIRADIPIQWASIVHPAGTSGWIPWFPDNSPGLAKVTRENYSQGFECPYGSPGDQLWVRETWAEIPDDGGTIVYRADDPDDAWKSEGNLRWRPAIYLPRAAARIVLEVTKIRVERLQSILEEEAQAEGITACSYATGIGYKYKNYASSKLPPFSNARDSFRSLWNAINGDRASWASNPWVWVIEFQRSENHESDLN